MRLAALLFLVPVVATTAGADPFPWQRTETRQPCANFDAFRQPYFGDTHVHTAYSSDAVFAGTREDPRGAYRFAQGAADRPAALRRAGAADAHGAAPPAARLHRRHRPRRAVRRDQHLPHARACPATTPPTASRLATSSPRRCRRSRACCRRPRSSASCSATASSTRRSASPGAGRAASTASRRRRSSGRTRRPRPRSSTTARRPARSRPSSPTSGAASRAATTSTATSSSATPSCRRCRPATWSSRRRRACGRRSQAQCLDGLPGCDVLAIPHNSNVSGGLMFAPVERRRQPAHRRRRRLPRRRWSRWSR